MDAPGQQFLAHAGFSVNQHGSVGRGRGIGLFQDTPHGVTGIDDSLVGMSPLPRGQKAGCFLRSPRRLVPAPEQDAHRLAQKQQKGIVDILGVRKVVRFDIHGVAAPFLIGHRNAQYLPGGPPGVRLVHDT